MRIVNILLSMLDSFKLTSKQLTAIMSRLTYSLSLVHNVTKNTDRKATFQLILTMCMTIRGLLAHIAEANFIKKKISKLTQTLFIKTKANALLKKIIKLLSTLFLKLEFHVHIVITKPNREHIWKLTSGQFMKV